jgi:hypothetical protein
VRVAVVSRDLMISTRIGDAGARAGVDVLRFDEPGQLPPAGDVGLVLVAWDERRPDWGERLTAWSGNDAEAIHPRVVLFGPHTDLEAHAAARAAGLGPMWARSKLLMELPSLIG